MEESSRIVIDPTSALAPYEQIRQQVVALTAGGVLQPGDRLPTVRQLAGDLQLAPNTVAKAYRELELGGHIRTSGRSGSFIAGDDLQSRAKEAAAAYVARAKALGLGPEDALALVSELFRVPPR